MMCQLTNEQAYELYSLLDATRICDHGQKASEWLSANLPAPVPVLRPIQEMPPEAPEGYARAYWDPVNGFCCSYTEVVDTHAIDALIPDPPDPEAELRREFEETMMVDFAFLDLTYDSLNGRYVAHDTMLAYRVFKAGKEAGCR